MLKVNYNPKIVTGANHPHSSLAASSVPCGPVEELQLTAEQTVFQNS